MDRKNRWPWSFWLNGETHVLQLGRDFACSLRVMQRKIHSKAWARGHRMSVRSDRTGTTLIVRSLDHDPMRWGPNGSVR